MADPNIQNILTDPVMRQVLHPDLYALISCIQVIRWALWRKHVYIQSDQTACEDH